MGSFGAVRMSAGQTAPFPQCRTWHQNARELICRLISSSQAEAMHYASEYLFEGAMTR